MQKKGAHFPYFSFCCRGCGRVVIALYLVSLSASVFGEKGSGSFEEVNLIRYLFDHGKYNHLIRPVTVINDTIIVDFSLAMIQLIHVDEKNQIMKSNVWLHMKWNDYQLKWDPADYGGIDVIRISSTKVWKPDIVLFNNADGKYEVSWQPNILIYYDGNIVWIPPAIYKSSCTIDVTYFPFDTQKCLMIFGSWTFDATQVNLGWYDNKTKVDLTDYWKSGTWDIIKCPGNIFDKSRIVYEIELKRKTLFYAVNLIIPCVLISFLSVCVFYLPADAGEKITLIISILLALVVFLLLVSKILPPTSKSIPLISRYLLFTFIMNIITIVITVVIINWNFRSPRTHKMARWVRVVFMQYLPRVLFMKRPEHIVEEERRIKQMNKMTSGKCNGSLTSRSPSFNSEARVPGPLHTTSSKFQSESQHHESVPLSLSLDDKLSIEPLEPEEVLLHHPNCRLRQRVINARDSSCGGSKDISASVEESPSHFAGIKITTDIYRAIAAINFIATHLRIKDDYDRVLQDWKYVASVIDRLQLVLFVTVTMVGTISILLDAPDIFKVINQEEILKS